MRFLADFLRRALEGLLNFFLKTGFKKTALVFTILTFIAGLSTAFFASIWSLLALIEFTLSDTIIGLAVSFFWTAHLSICISVLMSAHITRWVYDRSVYSVGLFANALK